MSQSNRFSRRRFLETAAALTVGTALSRNSSRLWAADVTRETEHFWCRLAAEGPYVDSQRENKAFGFGDGKIYLSEDNSRTWSHSAPFADAENITFSVFLKNGNILFATRNKLFLSTDGLKSHREIVVQRPDGSPYVPHAPQNPDAPGWYFHPLDGIHTWDVDGREMLVWGNYCNVLGGPVPARRSSSRTRSVATRTFRRREPIRPRSSATQATR
jgi:hypothetical protein